MNAVKKNKNKLRDEVLARRAELAEEDWNKKSRQIIQHLTDDEYFEQAHVVHCYVSMNERNEVCTDELIQSMLEEGKRVVVPVTNFSKVLLKHVEIEGLEELKSNKWGIREPEHEQEVPVEDLELIIIPMAAADRKGNRLGYGKGFYDRFLSKTNARKVGLVFKEFLFDEIPVEEYDVKLDVIITEDGQLIP